MKREIYICDRCHASAETKEQRENLMLADVSVGFGVHFGMHHPRAGTVYPGHKTWNAQWCLACRRELGIAGTAAEIQKQETVPSLEEMIREIIREEIPQQ